MGTCMRIDTNDVISVTGASTQGLSKLINEASKGRRLIVFRNNQPAAAIVDIKTMERLQYLEELEEDLKLIAVTWARSLTGSGERYSLEDVAAELGVDLDAEDESDS
jgi:PHD/YefM family antitoxin component YafN of YafNO toxin-antitoxin module